MMKVTVPSITVMKKNGTGITFNNNPEVKIQAPIEMKEVPVGPATLLSTKFLQLKTAPSPDGKHAWVYAHRPNVKEIAVIAPIIDMDGDGEISKGDSVMFVQKELPSFKAEGKPKICMEWPAGLVGDENPNETIHEAIARELLEETGYEIAEEIAEKDQEIMATNIASSGGCVSEMSTLAVVKLPANAQPKQIPDNDGGIIKDRHIVAIKDIPTWIKEQQDAGNAVDARVLSGLYFVLDKINKCKTQANTSSSQAHHPA